MGQNNSFINNTGMQDSSNAMLFREPENSELNINEDFETPNLGDLNL